MDEREASADAARAAGDVADDSVQGAQLPQDDADRDGVPAVFESRALAAFGYLSSAVAPWLIFVPILSVVIPPLKKSDYMRYHGWNALLLHVAVSVFRGLLNLANLPVALSGAECADSVCSMLSLISLVLVPTAATILSLHLGYEAIKRRAAHMPVLTPLAVRAAHSEEQETENAEQ